MFQYPNFRSYHIKDISTLGTIAFAFRSKSEAVSVLVKKQSNAYSHLGLTRVVRACWGGKL